MTTRSGLNDKEYDKHYEISPYTRKYYVSPGAEKRSVEANSHNAIC